jgi:5-methyltetrahydropteroyltriglutamate--homocysteine methyltransferase
MSKLPTEAIGSIPRDPELRAAINAFDSGSIDRATMEAAFDSAVRQTMRELEATGSLVISDGEQRKTHSFATYSVEQADNIASDGMVIPFQDGHVRQLPRLTRGPFRFVRYAKDTLALAKPYANVSMKQAVISASAMSMFYPPGGLPDYPREAFIEDLLNE